MNDNNVFPRNVDFGDFPKICPHCNEKLKYPIKFELSRSAKIRMRFSYVWGILLAIFLMVTIAVCFGRITILPSLAGGALSAIAIRKSANKLPKICEIKCYKCNWNEVLSVNSRN